MADEMMVTGEELEDDELVGSEDAVEEDPPDFADGAFVLMMTDEPGRLDLGEFDGEPLYIEAKPTGKDEDDVANAAFKFRGQAAGKRGQVQYGGVDIGGDICAVKAFLRKCELQITDFRIQTSEKAGGPVVVREYNPKNHGNNRDNEEIYGRFLANKEFMHLVEGFLDYVEGRDTPAQEDYEDFLGGR